MMDNKICSLKKEGCSKRFRVFVAPMHRLDGQPVLNQVSQVSIGAEVLAVYCALNKIKMSSMIYFSCS
jgi:hypothetical protein